MGEFSNSLLSLYARAAADQGGVISGDNPTHYSASNPIRLWILQLLLIVAITQILALALARIRQPRVIAEVIGGIILGPTVMGRIPGFKAAIFPDASIPLLVITSNIGLILFLFIIGLEIDTRILKRNLATSATVSAAGIALPLAMGAGLGVGVYNEFIDDSVSYGHFLLFIAVAVGITAFPVLCRILSDLKLLDTDVGLIVLSAGSCDDVVGWVLLALTVALVNSSGGLTALWVLLASTGFILFVLFPCRWAFKWLAKRTGSLEQGTPTPLFTTATLLFVFISAFFTDILGVHAIFGGFIAGIIIPHENGLAISMVEKIEDLVTILFLPIYFTLSGLRTNLGLLNTGVAWGYTILTCFVSLISKFSGCATAAYFRGFNWREAGAIGSLMSCKGLVELIVLNIGLQAGILEARTFSIFVVHALVLTFITTPMTLAFYPPKHRIRRDEKKASLEDGAEPKPNSDEKRSRFSIVFDKIEQLPAAMTLTQILRSALPLPSPPPTAKDEAESVLGHEEASIEALRLIELTSRTSAVLRSQEAESLAYNDSIISVYRTFGQLNKIRVNGNLSVVNHDEFPEAIAHHATQTHSQLVIVPWSRGVTSSLEQQTGPKNPFDGVFYKTTSEDQTSSVVYSEYIRRVFSTSPTDVALFVERGSASPRLNSYHFILPFLGGPDDRAALSLLVQLCINPEITATVVRIVKSDPEGDNMTSPATSQHPPTYHHTVAAADTVYGRDDTQTRLASDTADNVLWGRYALEKPSPTLSRINFITAATPKPLHYIVDLIKASGASNQSLIVLGGRSRRMAVESLQVELRELVAENAGGASLSSSVPRTLGDVGAAVVAANVDASLLIIQSAGPGGV